MTTCEVDWVSGRSIFLFQFIDIAVRVLYALVLKLPIPVAFCASCSAELSAL